MARYLRGTGNFVYKYVAGAQPANLDRLADVAGCGRGGMEPLMSASMESIGQTLEVPVIELFRELVLRTGSAEGFEEILFRGNVVPSHLGEEVDFVTPPAIVGLIALLDERLPAVAERVRFCARGVYEIEQAEYPTLLAYVNRHLPAPDAIRLDRPLSNAELESDSAKLGGADEYLPLLALCILNHVAGHRLARFEIREELPELDLGPPGPDFWRTVRTNSGPGEIRSDALPERPDALLARALIELWSGAAPAAKAALLRANERGDARADRWLKAFGVALAPRFGRPPTPERPRHVAELEAALDQREKGDDPNARALGEATRELALAHALRDAERLTTLLAQWPMDAALDPNLAANSLSVILKEGDPVLVARATAAVARRVARDDAESHVFYNLACGAAVLGWKDQMLDWLRVGKHSGDHPRDALTDSDFARFHNDPDLLALAQEP